MAYKLPKDDDGVRYHGVVDENDENPGQVLYGVDENGDYRPVNVDKDGNVLTKVTGSNVEQFTFFDRDIRTETTGYSSFTAVDNATGLVVVARVHGVTGDVSNGGVSFGVSSRFLTNILTINTEKHTHSGLDYITLNYGGGLGDAKGYYDSIKFYRTDIKILPGITYRCLIDIDGNFSDGEGVDCEVVGFWIKE